MTKVAIQGEAGAFSHEAAHKLLGPDIQLVTLQDIRRGLSSSPER